MSTNGIERSGALRDVRVVEFGQYIPGPLMGMLLSDQGAEVIKVERPEGDPARAQPAFVTWNRGKRSVVLDLKTEQGRNDAQRLTQTADVVIENFRPGVADRLGIGYDMLSKDNPGLIYCSLPGFGAESPYRGMPGWEPLVGATTGTYQELPETDGPLYTPVPIASTYAAMLGAVSVSMALIARRRMGLGQRIEVPLHQATFMAIGSRLIRVHDGGEPIRRYMHMASQYKCADGRYVQQHGPAENFIRPFFKLAGHPEWADEMISSGEHGLTPEEDAMLRERMESIFLTRTAQEWENDVSDVRGACAVCRTIDEWIVTDHARESGIVVEVDDPRYGTMKQPGVQVRVRNTPGAIQGPAPALGQHTEEILAEIREQQNQPVTSHVGSAEDITSVLQGVRVLDLCIVLAGPTCGRTLAEFGADVIKIDHPRRGSRPSFSIEVNRGKRSIRLDLKSEQGREVFLRLVDTADVVVENYRKGRLEELGLGYDEIKKRKPDIIYASLNTYGFDGPWSARPGWEQLAQAASGLQVRRGGRDGKPTLAPFPINDYGTGVMGAYAVSLALNERNRTGMGQKVDSALIFTATLLQSRFLLDYEGFNRGEPEGLGLRGENALSRLYQGSDDWLYMACLGQDGWKRLTGLEQFRHLASDERFSSPASREENQDALTQALSLVFSKSSTQHWIEVLNGAGIPAVPNVPVMDLLDDANLRKSGLIVSRDCPGFGMVDHIGNTVNLSRTPMVLGRPAPILGADADEILKEVGYDEQQMAKLREADVVPAFA